MNLSPMILLPGKRNLFRPGRGRSGWWVGVALLLALSPSGLRAQVVQQPVGAAFVYPIPQQVELGPVLDVIPAVLSDGFTINLTLIPTLTEFAGYDDPNAELPPSGAGLQNAIVVPTVLPRFRVRQVVTTVNVWDGQTVVLGGLISDNVIRIKDKVPVLGDIPLVGRFFRSESNTTKKKHLMIFVTPTIVDPAGNRYHSDDELPFAQTSIPRQPEGTVVTPPPGVSPQATANPPAAR